MTTLERLIWLDKQIKHHAKLYYEENNSEISDSEYDQLLFEYNNLITQFPDLADKLKEEITGPLIGATVVPVDLELEKLSNVKLDPPMLSLNNALSLEDFTAWESKLPESTETAKEYKYDGLAIRLIYVNGELESIVSRGTGLVGEDLTQSLPLIKGLPQSIPNPSDSYNELIVDGELVVSYTNFDLVNTLVVKPYATPRHMASGLSRTHNPSTDFYGTLEFFAYNLPKLKDKSHHELIKELRLLGFNTTSDFTVAGDWLTRPNIGYPIDGIVIKVVDPDVRESLGYTNHHPKWAIAYKFPKLTGSSEIKDCVWQVGPSGRVTGVLVFKPVVIGGSTIERCTLHNFKRFSSLAEGLKIGADITVGLGADIIPELVSIDSYGKGKQLKAPKTCPSCDTPLSFEGSDEEQTYLVCNNHAECPGQISGRLIRFASRKGFNIKGLGVVKITELVNQGIIRTFTDVLGLKDRFPNDVKLGKTIEESKVLPLYRCLYAIGIPGVGHHLSKVLSQNLRYDDKEMLFDQLTDKDWLMSLSGIEWDTALKIVNYVNVNLNELKALFELINCTVDLNVPVEKVVVLTGNFGGNRKVIEQQLLVHGIEVKSNVTKNVSAVFLGNGYTQHKEKKAIDLDIPVYRLSVDFDQVVNTIISYVN